MSVPSIRLINIDPSADSAALVDVPWEGIVGALESSNDVYVQGGIFVRYLICTYGIDAFLRDYEQSPEQRDPALFAANFQSFWNTTLDDVWTAIHVLPPGLVPAAERETKICPCSLPPLDPAGVVTNDPARAPYWPLPNPAGEPWLSTPDSQSGFR